MTHHFTAKLAIAGLLTVGILGATTSQASAKTKVRYYQDIKNASYTVTNSKATVYTSATLKHKKGTLKSYGSKVTGYYAAHITKNGKATIYYKFKVGKKTGWVWRGYLKKAATLPNIFNSSEKAQITSYQKTAKSIGNSTSGMYASKPVYKNKFAVGKLSSTYINKTLAAINLARGFYGLPNVTAPDSWNASAQYGAATLAAANQGLSHGLDGLTQPSFVSDAAWSKGAAATSQSNIAQGYSGAFNTISGYLNDSGNTMPGHRLWILGGITQVGVGQAGEYNDLKVFDIDSGLGHATKTVAYPNSGLFPAEWSVGTFWSLAVPSRYDASKVSIKVTDATTKQNVPVAAVQSDDGYGLFDTEISYLPKASMIKANHAYTISVSNFAGVPAGYSYTTKLFKIGSVTD